MPNTFQYLCYKDQGITGRLEVTVYKDQVIKEAADSTPGVKIHSKEDSCVDPSEDYAAFFEELQKVIQ